MSPSPQLADPGSSTYSSNTLHVGDGTWDSGRNAFLLPNLMGLNFETMRYNGMGNRFRGFPEYRQLITAHGILAVITFLFMVPAAIFIARFYHQNGRRALRIHIWIQVLVVFLSTVVLVLGWFAVGPKRSLTNPHHGIGVAIYVLIMFQFLFGSLVHHIEKGKTRYKIPLKLILHQWLGRTIALLAICQVALGLTLYGSPKYLFILYAVWVFILVLIYFVLTYRNQSRISIDDHGSYYSGSRTDATGSPSRGRKSSGRFGKIAAGLGAAGLLAAFANRGKSRSRSRSRTRTDVQSSRRTSESYMGDKYTDDGRSPKKHTWRDRLLAGAAGVGLATAARRVFSGGRKSDSSSSVSDYPHHPLGGSTTITQTDISRVEEGRVPTTPNRRADTAGLAAVPAAMTSPSRHSRPSSRPGRRPSGTSIDSYDSRSDYYSPGKAKQETHTLRNGIAALGVAGYLRHKFKQNKNKKDDRRVEEMRRRERENERINRHASGSQRPPRYTGDGAPSRARRHNSVTESEMSPLRGSNPELSLHSLPRPSGGRTDITTSNTLANSGLPPPPPIPGSVRHNDSSNSSIGRARHSSRNRHGRGEAAAAGLAAGAAGVALAGNNRNSSRRRNSEGGGSVNSPPVSVKVKMHNDGRHVTLRRLDPAEAAAEREARRRQGKGRSGSISSQGGGASGDEHWRRVERMEAEQAAQQHNIPPIPAVPQNLPGPPPGPPPPPSSFAGPSTYGGPASTMDLGDLPPPPPIPGAAESGLGGGSPGSIYGSGPSAVDSRAESNRKRRRAERARALQARQEGRGNKVDFT